MENNNLEDTEWQDVTVPSQDSSTSNLEDTDWQDVNIPNQTVLDDSTGNLYSVPITMDGTDTQFSIDTQVKGKGKENYFAKAKITDKDDYGVSDYIADAFRSSGRGLVEFAGSFSRVGKGVFSGERELREAQYKAKDSDKARVFFSNYGVDPSLVPPAVIEATKEEVDKAITTLDEIKKRDKEWWEKSAKDVISDQKLTEHPSLSIIKDVTGASASVVVSVLGMVAARNPTVGAGLVAGLFGMQQEQESYDKAIEAGIDPFTAKGYSMLQGTLNGGIELAGGIVLGKLANLAPIKKINNDVVQSIARRLLANKVTQPTVQKVFGALMKKSIMKSAAKSTLPEVGEEVAQSLAVDIGDNLMNLEEFSGEEILNRALYSGAMALLPSAVTGAVGTKLYNRAVQRVYDGLKNDIKAINPDLTEQEASDFANAAMEVLYQNAPEYAEATNEVLEKDLDPDVIPENYTPKDLTENMTRILQERYGYTEEQIKKLTDATNKMLDMSKQYSEVYTALYNALVDVGRKASLAESEARLTAARVMALSVATGKSASEVLQRWNLRFKGHKITRLPKQIAKKIRRAKAVKKNKPLSLLSFLIKRGGIKDESGELKNMDAHKVRPGLVNNKRGLPLDMAREAVEEAGYFGAFAKNNLGTTSVADLLDLISRELAGEKIYSDRDRSDVQEMEAAKSEKDYLDEAEDYYERVLAENGIDYSKMSFDEKAEAAQKFVETELVESGNDLSEEDLDALLSGTMFQQSLDLAQEMADIDANNDEYTGETINIDGVEKPVYNSNGERIAKSEEALRAFYKWFGDSKVVDEQGRPLVVYHGTNAEFDTFDKTTRGKKSRGVEGKIGFWFSEKEAEYGFRNKMPVYLRMSNPKVFSSSTKIDSSLEYERAKKEKDYDTQYFLYRAVRAVEARKDPYDKLIIDLYHTASQIPFERNFFGDLRDVEQIQKPDESVNKYTEKLVSEGYDGIIIKGTNYDREMWGDKNNQYIAFEPNQIKSTSNRGTFDINNPNIYYQFAGERSATAAFDDLEYAEMLEYEGKSKKQILEETGWFRGPDGKWRYEISDKNASVQQEGLDRINKGEKIKLKDLLKHDELYKAYPAFAEGNVFVDNELAGTNVGAYVQGDGSGDYTIHVRPGEMSLTELKKTLLHEIQHNIQAVEHFARGGNPEQITSGFVGKYNENVKKNREIVKMTVLDDDYRGYYVLSDKYSKLAERYNKLHKELGKLKVDHYYEDNQKKREKLEERIEKKQKLFDEVDRKKDAVWKTIQEKYGKKLDEYYKKILDLEKQNPTKYKLLDEYIGGIEGYRRLYGEIEARNTEARSDMTLRERISTLPEETQDIKDANAIIVFDDGTTASYNQGVDFYATHNIDRGGLIAALKLGGLAMPSFAVRRIGSRANNQFGEITLVGNKKLASPSRSVEVYDRDAWSPSISYALKYDLSPKANAFVKNILKKHGKEREFSTFIYNIVENIKDPEGNTMAKDLYALDKGLPEERIERVGLGRDPAYLEWYEKNIFENAEPYLWTENDAKTDMIRRKFTLQNMMKYLRQQERSGGGWIGDFPDAGRLLQYFSYKFPSLKAMKERKENITSREEQFQNIQELDKEFFDLAEEIKKDGQEYEFYDAQRELAYALVTDKGIKESLERGKMKSDEETIKKVEAFKEKLKSVATDYFEAKPRRIVGIEEFSGAILPNTKEYDDIANQLKQKGLTVKRVDIGNTEQHERALNEIQSEKPNVFFQSAYHGTDRKLEGGKFDLKYAGKNVGLVHGYGVYAVASKPSAKYWAGETGNVYELDVPEDFDLIDEQKRLSEQPENVRNTIIKAAKSIKGFGLLKKAIENDMPGGEIYVQLGKDVFYDQNGYEGGSTEIMKAASEYLENIGIKGITFDRAGEKNFVIFNPDNAKVIQRFYQSAYAGSRVDYDKPSLEAIGSGEGNQAHGWGLYYALDRDVAENYREKALYSPTYNILDSFRSFTVDGKPFLKVYKVEPTEKLLSLLRLSNELGYNGKLLDYLESKIKQWKGFKDKGGNDNGLTEKYQKLYDDVYSKGSKLLTQGQVHEVDIPEPEFLLDEQKKYNDQSDYVKARLEDVFGSLTKEQAKKIVGDDKTPVKNMLMWKNGREIYNALSYSLGSDKEASKLLEANGIKGITYDGRQDGRCFVIFNPDDVKIIQKFYQNLGENPRGAFYSEAGKNIIELFQNADASTVIHELGHFFLEDMRTYNDDPETKKQLEAIYKYVGSLDGNLSRDQHEYFARSFEAYLMEGKSPNNMLQRVFKRFKSWLSAIYNEVKNLDVDLDDNIRKVFDEMLGGKGLDYTFGLSQAKFDEKVRSGEVKLSKVREKIKRLLEWAEPRNKNGKIVARFPDIEINKQFDYIRGIINTKKQDAIEKIAENVALIDEITNGTQEGDVDALRWENKLLSVAAGKVNADIMLDVYHAIYDMYNTGRFAESITGALKKERLMRMRDRFLKTIEQGAGAQWRKQSSKLKQVIRTLGQSYTGWNGLLDILSMFDKTTKVGESAINEMLNVYNEELEMRYGVAKDGEMLSDIFGKKLRSNEPEGISVSRYINKLYDKVLIEWGDNAKEFTKDEIIDIWMKAKDPETLEIMLNDEILQYNEEFLARIDENMTADDIAFAESLFEFYDKSYDKLNKFYADHYGMDLGKRDYYSPRSMEIAGVDVTDNGLSKYAGLSAIKKRTAKRGAIKIKGAYNVFTNYITSTNHWMSFSDKLIDINSILGDVEIKNVIRSLFGQDMNKRLAQEISRFATNDKNFAQKLGGWLNKLRANYAVSVLGAKPSITIKQLVSFPAYWEKMSAAEFMVGLADFAKHPVEAIKTLSKSKYMQTRGTNITRDLEIVSSKEFLKTLGTKIGLKQFLMLNVKLGDRGAIYLGGWALYKKVLKETGSAEKAMEAFEKVTNETQQSSFMSEQSSWQSNPFGAMFTMFHSAQNQYLRKEMNAIRGILTGRMDATQAGKTLFIYHFLLPMLFQLVSDGLRWDKDKQFRAALLGSLNGAFIIGDVLDRLAEFAISGHLNMKKDISELIPFLTTIQKIGKSIEGTSDYIKGNIDLEDYIDAMLKFSEAVGEATGIPLKYPKDVINNIGEYLEDEEYFKSILLLLGWSPYALRDIENN